MMLIQQTHESFHCTLLPHNLGVFRFFPCFASRQKMNRGVFYISEDRAKWYSQKFNLISRTLRWSGLNRWARIFYKQGIPNGISSTHFIIHGKNYALKTHKARLGGVQRGSRFNPKSCKIRVSI